MKHLVRTFVGLRCGPTARKRLHAAGAALRGEDHALRLPASEDLHITLHYLGATPPEDIPALAEAMEEAAVEVPPFEVAYRGLGAFPDAGRPRVAWVGVEDPEGGPSAALADLQRRLGRTLRAVGYRPERRAFHPHVTLARVHRRPEARVLETLAGPGAAGGAQPLDLGGEILSELKLMLSDPGHRPYHYIDLTTVDLG